MNDDGVAPFAGAWIEIKSLNLMVDVLRQSLPSRERGLKSGAGGTAVDSGDGSLPSRERGLKS